MVFLRTLIFVFMLIFGAAILSGCEEQEKKAAERGRKPQEIIKDAQKSVDEATEKMKENMRQMEESTSDTQ